MKSERHWNHFTGYFQKHGYFKKDKAHQSKLPKWAMEKKTAIRRIGRKAGTKKGIETLNRFRESIERMLDEEKLAAMTAKEIDDMVSDDLINKQLKEMTRKTQGQMLNECGSKTTVFIGFGFSRCVGDVQLPYAEFRKLEGGEYREGVGFIVPMKISEFREFKNRYLYNSG